MKLQSILKKIIVLSSLIFISFQMYAQEIGLQLYSLRKQFKTDVPGTLAKIKSWNIKEIEGGDTYGLPVNKFKKLLAENNLKVVSVSADYDQLIKNPQAAVDAANNYGAKYIVCFWIPHDGDEFTIDDMKKAADAFNTAGKFIHDKGLTLCYHPHGYEFGQYESGTLFDYLVQHTDSKYLNFEMDVFWVKQAGQNPVALLEKYPKRFLMLHLKDRKPGTEDTQTGQADEESNVVLGTGDVNIAAIMKTAKKIGIKYYFIEDESSKSTEQIPQSLSYLRQLK